MNKLLTNTNTSFQEISLRVSNILNEMDNLLYNISNSKGTLGLLCNEKTLYSNVNQGVNNVNHILRDFYKRPSRYIDLTLLQIGSKKILQIGGKKSKKNK